MMTNTQLAAASFDDIVFDGRNKGYGAYELRGLYQRHVSRALVIATTIFALLVTFPLVANYLKGPAIIAPPRPDVPVEPYVLPPDSHVITPPPPAAITPPPAQPAPQIRYSAFRVTRTEEATETPPNVEELTNKKIGSKTIEGPDVPAASLDDIPPTPGPATVAEAAPTDKPYLSVEQMPELPGGGGVAAIVAAIQKSVRYPARAISAGVEGKVYVSFVVNTKGDVTDVKVIKGLGAGLDEETMRAINSLPRFIPGKQNGREVSVSYSVPITFKIQ